MVTNLITGKKMLAEIEKELNKNGKSVKIK